MSAPWTEAGVAILKELWGVKSASQIATKLGAPYTRNAVIGKVHRLRLSLGAARAKFIKPTPAPPWPKHRVAQLIASIWPVSLMRK